MDRELIRLPVGPSAPRIPSHMTVPGECRVIPAGVLPDTASWDERYGGPWLLISENEVVVDAPPEFFLRELLPLDTTDDEAFAAWCGRWGVPRLPPVLFEEDIEVVLRHNTSDLLESLGIAPPVGPPRASTGTGAAALPRQLLTSLKRAVSESGAAARYLYDDQRYFGAGESHWYGLPLAVARLGAQVLQSLVRWWTWVVPPEITIEWLSEVEPEPEYFLAWWQFGFAANQLEGLEVGLRLLNSMLAEAHPLQVRAIRAPDGHPLGAEQVTVNDLVAIELARYIHEQIPARQCANETCRLMYVRQSGRAAHGQNRTRATKYCSDRCAHAQAQRMLRRRKAQRREE